MEKSLRATNLIALGWLLAAIGLSGGCGSRTPSVKEEPPPAVSTKFDRLPALLAGMQPGVEITVHEGLPDQFWEPGVREKELAGKKTVRFHGYPFYEEARQPESSAARDMTAVLAAPNSYFPFTGLKNSGEYNADYCVTWKSAGQETQALVSFAGGEIKLYGPNADLHCDLTPAAAQKLQTVLRAFLKNRPVGEGKL